jgi:hypothetical protein
MKENKRLKRLLGLLSQKVLTQSDIRSLKTALNLTSKINKADFVEIVNHCNGFDITKEHSDIGIKYLTKTFFKKNGDPRKTAFDDLTDHDINVLKNFKKFKFVGFDLYRPHFQERQYDQYEIIYRVIAKNGDWFDYLAVSWQSGQFEVLRRNGEE